MMTNTDLLGLILAAADDQGRVFDHAEIALWPPGSLEQFCHLKLIRRGPGGLYAPCPNCTDGHIEPVTIRVGPDGTKRFYIWCPESMRVEVQPEMCNGWQVDLAGLAAVLAGALGLKGRPKPVVADRLWRLGRTPWPPGSSNTREVVFVRRMQDDDAPAVAAHIGAGGRAIALVPQHVPDTRVWSGPVPAVIPLSELMTWHDDQPVLDVVAMADAVGAADDRAASSQAIALGPTGKRMVRRQVKAEIKSLLTDDAYMAAYKEHGSYRRAAEALTQQTGQPISKDKVRRAVERHGGRADVISDEDSASVARTVASQRRDKSKKFIERR
ncbi:MAG: hypothetical protein Kow0010_26620 [Dehalococcoidia bacterium]